MANPDVRVRWLPVLTGLILLAALLAVPTVRAFEGRGGDIVTIGADEVIEDDLYVAAGEFTLDGTVKGDLVVVGSTLTINGTVEGDLIAAGQSVVVNGSVEDDARVAGFALTVQGDIADDVIAAGFSLEGREQSSVGGDVLYAGYQALLAGDVGGDVDASGGAVRIAGAIQGEANVDVGGTDPGEQIPPFYSFIPNLPAVPSVPAGLTVEEGARINGDLNYTANAEARVPADAVGGDVDFNRYVAPETEAERRPAPTLAVRTGRWFLRQIRRLVTLLLIGALMMWAVPGWTRKLAKNVETQTLPSLGWGVVAVAVFGVLMVMLVIATIVLTIVFGVVTLGGLAGRFAVLGGIVTTATGFSFGLLWRYVSSIAIALLLGQLIFRALKSPAEQNRWWPMVLGVVILVIITAVPVLGWLARLGVVLLGLGAVWIWGRDLLTSRRGDTAAAEA
ncbi:MAG: polymer-forming cytoskeletal protein [Anaerolineae bacterium]|jgi:cytoskeletal protein CcmA (bactofilin family)